VLTLPSKQVLSGSLSRTEGAGGKQQRNWKASSGVTLKIHGISVYGIGIAVISK
jgi:hypothetical protein